MALLVEHHHGLRADVEIFPGQHGIGLGLVDRDGGGAVAGRGDGKIGADPQVRVLFGPRIDHEAGQLTRAGRR